MNTSTSFVPVRGWHFLHADKRLGYGDGRLVEVGRVLTVDVPAVLCDSGLHWSERLIDAINYAPGAILCRVESVEGHPVHKNTDKSVSTARRCVAMVDAEDMFSELSRKWAASVFWQHFKREDYPAVVAWLDNGDKSARSAARSAAESAAQRAARSAAWSAACSAAWSAAESAAWSTARSTAWSAAESAAWSAPWSTARSAAWGTARSAAESAAESAARSAARSAGESAARSVFNDEAEAMALALLGCE